MFALFCLHQRDHEYHPDSSVWSKDEKALAGVVAVLAMILVASILVRYFK